MATGRGAPRIGGVARRAGAPPGQSAGPRCALHLHAARCQVPGVGGASLLALARGEIPISARCAEPDPELALGRTRGDAMTSPWALDPRWVLLKCTNGFAGQNGAMVLRSVDG